ncbi:unnamed protein product [Prorocentrum cordatum]|uniref:Uncharacterized protein n=1 Tax=Prorocentrum cordatum TaxID=2364126 RepID=A0ABN9PEV9_9DINO|nr:unnamed protein product [Polarella glacialis]
MAAAADTQMAGAPARALAGPRRKGGASAEGEKEAKSKNEKHSATLKLHWNHLLGQPRETAITQLQDPVRHCRVRDCWHDKKKEGAEATHCKVQLMMSPHMQSVTTKHHSAEGATVSDAVQAAILKENGVLKPGSAPRGALERGAEKLLRKLGMTSDRISKAKGSQDLDEDEDEVCGSQISWRALEELDARARGRPHPHEMGAWHVGWARVRSALETVDEAIKECDEGQRVGSGGGKPAREAPSTTGLRGGEAVKDRGSRGGEAGDDRSKAMGANEAFEGEASKERRRSRGKSRQRSKVKRGMRSSCSESGQRKAEAEAEEVKATKRRKAKEASSSPEAAKGKRRKAKEASSSPEAAKGKGQKAKEAKDSSPKAAKGKGQKAKEAKDSSPEAAKGKRRKAKEAKDSSPEAAKGKRRKAKEADSSPESAQQKKRSAKRQRRSSSSSSVRSLRKGRVKDTKREGKAQRQVNGDDGPRKKNKKGGKLKKKEDTSSG